jgi:hypothetical protein
MVAKGWTLLELRRDAQSLDVVFRDLTRGDEKLDRGANWTAADEADRDEGDDEDDKSGADDEDDQESDEDDEDEEVDVKSKGKS